MANNRRQPSIEIFAECPDRQLTLAIDTDDMSLIIWDASDVESPNAETIIQLDANGIARLKEALSKL